MGVESVFLGSGRKQTLGKGWEEAWTVCHWPQQVLELGPEAMGGSPVWQQDVGLIRVGRGWRQESRQEAA